jgi:hypothetical protein
MSDYRRRDAPVTKGGRGINDVLAASIRAKYALPMMQSLLSIAGIENKRKGGEALLGDGEVNVSGMMQSDVTFIAIQPALAFIMSEATSFGQLRAYAKRG